MSMSDCIKCYDTPCTCGYGYRNYTVKARISLASVILGVSESDIELKLNVPINHPDKFKKVSKNEYLEFIKNYPKPLEFDCTGICEPPLGTYNDSSDGKMWPESIVAKEIRNWLDENGKVDNTNALWEYFIIAE